MMILKIKKILFCNIYVTNLKINIFIRLIDFEVTNASQNELRSDLKTKQNRIMHATYFVYRFGMRFGMNFE